MGGAVRANLLGRTPECRAACRLAVIYSYSYSYSYALEFLRTERIGIPKALALSAGRRSTDRRPGCIAYYFR